MLPLTYFTKLTRDVMVRNHHIWSDGGSLGVVARLGRDRLGRCDSRLPLAAAGRLSAPHPGHSYVDTMMEPSMAFAVHRHDAARDRGARQLRRLRRARGDARPRSTGSPTWLLDEVGEVSIISEERHEIDAHVEASVHQVRIEVAADRVPADGAERGGDRARIVERAEHWARLCVAERHVEIADGL